MFFASPPTSFCLGTALMSPLTVLEAFDFHPFIFSELHFDQKFFPCPTHEILLFSLPSASKFLQILCVLLCWTAIPTNMAIWSLDSHLNVPLHNMLNPTLLTCFSWHIYKCNSWGPFQPPQFCDSARENDSQCVKCTLIFLFSLVAWAHALLLWAGKWAGQLGRNRHLKRANVARTTLKLWCGSSP